MRHCVVTGGANGIGRCITETFINNGDFVIIIDNDKQAGQWLSSRYEGKLFFFHGDIGKKEDLDAFLNELKSRFPTINVIVNNAMKSMGGLFDCGYDEFDYALRVGAVAPFYLTKQLLPQLVQGASIINISSTRAFMSQSGTESYSAAKGAISALTHALAASLSGKARVNAICPGWIDVGAYHGTGDNSYIAQHSNSDHKQHPAGRVGVPSDIADMVLFLSSEQAGFITGESITIDGGMTKLMIYHNDHGWSYKSDNES